MYQGIITDEMENQKTKKDFGPLVGICTVSILCCYSTPVETAAAAAKKTRNPSSRRPASRRRPMPSCCCLLGLGFPSPPSALRILRRRMASRAFQLRLNPLTGDSEWLVVEEEEEEDHHPTPPPKQLLATTSYLDMLNDSARNRAYRRAIEAAVTDPSSRVLDIGSANPTQFKYLLNFGLCSKYLNFSF